MFGKCKCRTSRILLCPTAEENEYEPCKRRIPAKNDFSHENPRCPYHQNLLEKKSQDNEEKEEAENKETDGQHVGIIRSCSKDETWYFSPIELGAGRITVDSKGEERRFPAKSSKPVKNILVRITIPPPPPPPPPVL